MAETVYSNLRLRGTLTVAGLTTLALVTITNTLTLRKSINFTPNGTTSGAVVQVNGVTEIQAYTIPCVATGGNVKVSNGAKYDTCYLPNPLGSTGAIKELSLMVVNSPNVLGVDCSFVKARVSGSGAPVVGVFNNIQTATGSIYRYTAGSGSIVVPRWNSADAIKCGTLTTPNSAFSAYLRAEFYDDRSE